MTEDEKDLRILILEDAIEQAQRTISFLHYCLVDPKGYKYEYPQQTISRMEKFEELYKPMKGCIHSMYKEDCNNCMQRLNRIKLIATLQKKIDSN